MVLKTQVRRSKDRGRAYVVFCTDTATAAESGGREKLVCHTRAHGVSLRCPVFFDVIMGGLKTRLQHLEEEEILQQMLKRGSQIGLEPPPSDDNIDSLMRSMVAISTADSQRISDGPWKGELHNLSNDSFNYEDTVVKGKEKL